MNNLRKHRTFLFVVLIAFLGTAYSMIGLTSWKVAMVGDEWACFLYAKGIADQKLRVNPFGLHGVYGEQQVLESYYQAIVMFLFGKTLAVWKLSNMILLFPSLIFLYKFVRKLYGRNPALIAAILMTFSKYLTNIFKIGNPHCLGFFLLILCLYFSSELLFTPTTGNAITLGIALGLSFYAYVGPIFSFFLLPFVIPFFRRHGKSGIKPVLAIILVFLGIVVIGFATTPKQHWMEIVTKTPLQREFGSYNQLLINIGQNFVLFFKNYDYFYNHFVVGPYLDIISRWAAFTGIILSLVSFWKKKGVLLGLWISLCIGIGITNPYHYTPSTRGIFFIPYGVMFAGIGLDFLRRTFKKWGATYFVAILILVAIGLNIYEAHVGVFKKAGFSYTALIIKELLKAEQQSASILLYFSEDHRFDSQHVYHLMDVHGIEPDRFTMTPHIFAVYERKFSKLLVFKHDHTFWKQEGSKIQVVLQKEGIPMIVLDGYPP